jgi:hypothetical protein
MGRPRRHSSKPRQSNPEELAASLPGRLSNPNACMQWESVDEHRRAVAHYLRTTGVSADLSTQLAPEVSAATGVALCIVLKNRRFGEPQHAT